MACGEELLLGVKAGLLGVKAGLLAERPRDDCRGLEAGRPADGGGRGDVSDKTKTWMFLDRWVWRQRQG